MSEIHVVTVPISGIFLEGMEELAIGTARIFSNAAALPFLGNLPFDLRLPNTSIPLNAEIKGVPPAPFDAEIRQLGIARYLLQVEIETPTNTITGVRCKEELEWAILPLRILAPARILLGLTTYCRGGFEHCGGIDWRIKMRQEGFLGSAPQSVGWSSFCGITPESAQLISKFCSVVNLNRDTLLSQLRVPLDNFWNSFYLPSYSDRGMQLLIVLESLLSERNLREGIRGRVTSRVRYFQSGDRIKKKRRQRIVDEAFGVRKDVEHGLKSKTEVEEYFMGCIEEIEEIVRHVFYKTIYLLNQGLTLNHILPGLKEL